MLLKAISKNGDGTFSTHIINLEKVAKIELYHKSDDLKNSVEFVNIWFKIGKDPLVDTFSKDKVENFNELLLGVYKWLSENQ